MSRGRDCSSSRNFASNSTSEMPNAPAVTLFGAPNAIIARTKRRSESLKFETSLLSSAASTFLSAATRDVMAFRFRPDPGLAPPRPIPLDFVISNPLNFWRPSGALSSKGREQPSHCREIGLAQAGIDAPRPCGPVPWSCRRAPRFDLFAARHDHKQFRAWPGSPRESVSGVLDAAMKRRAGLYSGGLSALLSQRAVSDFSGSLARQLPKNFQNSSRMPTATRTGG